MSDITPAPITALPMTTQLRELWRYHALVQALVSRHLATRYRGSALGFLWTLLNPLCLMAVYTLVFHYYMRAGASEHYTSLLFVGLLPWLWTVSSLHEGTASIVSSGHLITKSMFPAQVLPVVAVIASLVNFLLSLPLMLVFLFFDGIVPHPTLILLPIVILLQGIFLFGLTLMLSALNVRYRDVQHLVGNVLTFLFFLTPIIYPPQMVPDSMRFTLQINPLAAFTVLYHDVVLHGVWPSPLSLLGLTAWALISLLVGSMVFSRYRESFAESL